MQALLVRAHETDTNAWYPVATSQPLASTVRIQRRGINAHQRCREEEQLREASKSERLEAMGAMGLARRDASKSNASGKRKWLMRRKKWETKNRTKRNAIAHLAPDSRGPVFFA